MGEALIGRARSTCALRQDIAFASRCDAKVLITGESGVGKELVTHSIHKGSARAGAPLVTVNCAALSESLLESELFGHARGSFTGALRDRRGLLDIAHRGTLFMDEVGETSPRMQSMLLRFLETGEIQRVGADGPNSRVDVRIIAATNRNLGDAMATGAFREDLYYRLNVIQIRVPPLRDRLEDIPELLAHFAAQCAQQYRLPSAEITSEFVDALRQYHWPGNVRELRNLVERMVLQRSAGRHFSIEQLTPDMARGPLESAAPPKPARPDFVLEAFNRMAVGRESFWCVVHTPFMERDVTREQLRQIVSLGLGRTAGSYRLLMDLFNMKPEDYKRFLAFLKKHRCHVAFQPFRMPPLRVEGLSGSEGRPHTSA